MYKTTSLRKVFAFFRRYWHVLLFAGIGIFASTIWFLSFQMDQDGLQRGVFFSDRYDWFMDYFNTIFFAVGKRPYSWGYIPAHGISPFSYLLLFPFEPFFQYNTEDLATAYMARLEQVPAIFCAVFLTFSFLLLFLTLYRSSRLNTLAKAAVLYVLFTSSVTLFNFDRANEIILNAALSIVFLEAYDSKKWYFRQIAYISLAVAFAMKIFPALFGVLLLYKKKWWGAVETAFLGFGFFIIPFFLLEGGIQKNFPLFIDALKAHTEAYSGGSLDIGLGATQIFPFLIPQGVAYSFLALALVLTPFLKKKWQQMMLLSLAVLMTSGQQGYYCLIYLFYPIVLFFDEKSSFRSLLPVLLFNVILCPYQFAWEWGAWHFTNVRVTNTLLTILYLALIIFAALRLVGKLIDHFHDNKLKEGSVCG